MFQMFVRNIFSLSAYWYKALGALTFMLSTSFHSNHALSSIMSCSLTVKGFSMNNLSGFVAADTMIALFGALVFDCKSSFLKRT
uniref:Uncharacterized protein n=1 Tax=Ixodes ricinus TaxID=34613 RepID=A0A6B0UEK0_IXORI